MSSYQLQCEITRSEEMSPGLVRLTVNAPEIASQARPGQFVMVKAGSLGAPLLRRPFSIHQADANGRIQLLVKVIGKGTSFLSHLNKGDKLEIVGPLGKGFSLAETPGNICLVGGGVGSAPLFFLVKALLRAKTPGQIKVVLGSATAKELDVLSQDFCNLGVVPMRATDDGSCGYRGLVTDLLPDLGADTSDWQIMACGPKPMMRKVAEICEVRAWKCQVSLETVMACGISACLGCTVKSSARKMESSGRPYLHVCKDGPVFDSGDVAWI